MKFWKEKTQISEDILLEDAFIFMRGTTWHLHIIKKPHWEKAHNETLGTKDKKRALDKAKKVYDNLIGSENLVKKSLFDKEDRIIAGTNSGLGRIAESKFQNLMMIKNYEVYIPVEDLWGNDCVLFKDGVTYRVQLKSSNSEMPTWALQNNNKVKYKDTSTHMGFIYLPEGRIWFVPLSVLPDVSCLRHPRMKTICKDYEVTL